MTTDNLTLTTPLHSQIETAVQQHLANLHGETPNGLYELFLGEFEKPLLVTILKYTHGNQSKAAQMLGLNRGTLRTKLKAYDLLKK